MAYPYDAPHGLLCLAHKEAVFVGDLRAREAFEVWLGACIRREGAAHVGLHRLWLVYLVER